MITVTGGRAKQRQQVYRAAGFAWNYLMPLIRKCDVSIELKRVKMADGYCMKVDDREWEIEISKKLKGEDLLTTVFHEMVHVKQGVRREWEFDEVPYKTHEEYINLPWEVEAYQLQEEILEAWNRRSGSL